MATVQMNVRIDGDLKEAGDKALKELGVSATDAVRALWAYVADRKAMPDLSTHADEAACEEERRRRLRLVEESAGMVHRELMKAGLIGEDEDLLDGMSYKELRESMYARKLDEYLEQRSMSHVD